MPWLKADGARGWELALVLDVRLGFDEFAALGGLEVRVFEHEQLVRPRVQSAHKIG